MSRKCYLCQNDFKWIDYTNRDFLKYYLTEFNQIKPRKETGLCRQHQRDITKAIKKARQMAILK